jgi:hypothetical protein
MPDNEPQTLAILLGVEAGEDRSALKKAAYRRYRESLKSDDIDAQMAALDDYINMRDPDNG